ncbi:MAG: hypothetical protein ABWY83_01585 [Actinomycetota bacterium]
MSEGGRELRRFMLLVVGFTVLATVFATPAVSVAPNRGCPPPQAGWELQTFQENFDANLQDALDAGFTVEELLALFEVSSLEQLYEENFLPVYLLVDHTTGDGLICAKEPTGIERQQPWFSSLIDNVMPS